MKTEIEIREQRALLHAKANEEEISLDRQIARAVVHTLTWMLDDSPTSAPADQIGWVDMALTPEHLEVIRFVPNPEVCGDCGGPLVHVAAPNVRGVLCPVCDADSMLLVDDDA